MTESKCEHNWRQYYRVDKNYNYRVVPSGFYCTKCREIEEDD